MHRTYFTTRFPELFLTVLFSVVSTVAHAGGNSGPAMEPGIFASADSHHLAQADDGNRTDLFRDETPSAPAVRRILSEPAAQPGANEKKCMLVCENWGEECTYIDRGPAGTTRSCRRTCQQFTEECF